MNLRIKHTLPTLGSLLLALMLAGCGGDDDDYVALAGGVAGVAGEAGAGQTHAGGTSNEGGDTGDDVRKATGGRRTSAAGAQNAGGDGEEKAAGKGWYYP